VAVILVAAAVVLFVTGSDGSSSPPTGPIPASAATATTTTTTSSSASGTDVLDQITLKPTAAGGGATGEAAVVKDGSQELITFAASHLASPGNGEYVLWLYNSPTQYEALGRVSSVKNGNTGSVAVALPSDASSYRGVMLTLETSTSPTSPGTAVLTGISSSPL
jgi:hypothetical protein